MKELLLRLVHLSICLSDYLSIYSSCIYLSFWLSIYQACIYLSTMYPSIFRIIYLSINHLSIFLFSYLYLFHLYVNLSTLMKPWWKNFYLCESLYLSYYYLSFYLSVYLYVHLSILMWPEEGTFTWRWVSLSNYLSIYRPYKEWLSFFLLKHGKVVVPYLSS